MKPSKEIKDTYRKVVMDSIYTNIDNWYKKDLSYCVDIDDTLIRINEFGYTRWVYPDTIVIKKKTIYGKRKFLFSMSPKFKELKYLIKIMIKYVNDKNQKKFDSELIDLVPITIKRRLKIEKIYK